MLCCPRTARPASRASSAPLLQRALLTVLSSQAWACFGWTSQMPGASCLLLPTGPGSMPFADMISFACVAAPCDIAVTPCCARHSSTLQQVPAGSGRRILTSQSCCICQTCASRLAAPLKGFYALHQLCSQSTPSPHADRNAMPCHAQQSGVCTKAQQGGARGLSGDLSCLCTGLLRSRNKMYQAPATASRAQC